MDGKEVLESLSKEQLIELVGIYARDELAMDGVWFQAVERAYGMDGAVACDAEAWKRYTVIEAERIRRFLALGERPGLAGLERALKLRFYWQLNGNELAFDESGALVYTVRRCRVQYARQKKGLPLHPCKGVAVFEYGGFAKTVDERIETECLSCYPDVTDAGCSCKWRFVLSE